MGPLANKKNTVNLSAGNSCPLIMAELMTGAFAGNGELRAFRCGIEDLSKVWKVRFRVCLLSAACGWREAWLLVVGFENDSWKGGLI